MARICFDVIDEQGPALVSAIEEQRNELGGRLEGAHRFKKEDALTRAASAIGTLHAALLRVFGHGDPDYAR